MIRAAVLYGVIWEGLTKNMTFGNDGGASHRLCGRASQIEGLKCAKPPWRECVDQSEKSQEVLEWPGEKHCERTDLGGAVSLYAGDCGRPLWQPLG